MEQWEHMAVSAASESGKRTLTEISADGEARELEGSGVAAAIAALNRLGREGWQLVSTDELSNPSFWARTYWLKRQVSEGGWATSI